MRRVACERIGQERLGAYCDRVREAFEAYVSSGGWWVEDEEEEVEEGEESPVSASDTLTEGEEKGKNLKQDEVEDDARTDESGAWTDVTFLKHARGDEGDETGMEVDSEHHLGKAERDKVDEQVRKLIQGLEAQANAQPHARSEAAAQAQAQPDSPANATIQTGEQTYAQAAAAISPVIEHAEDEDEGDEGQDAHDPSQVRGRKMSRPGSSRSPCPSADCHSASTSPVPTESKTSSSATAKKGPPGLIPASVVSAPNITVYSPPLTDKVNSPAASARPDLELELDVDMDMDEDDAMDAEIAALREEGISKVDSVIHTQTQAQAQAQEQVLGKGLRVELDVLEEDGEDELMR